MSTDLELTELRDLLQHPGWLRLKAYADAQVGPKAYALKVSQAVAKERGPESAYELADEVRRIDATNRALKDIMDWPATRVGQLTPQVDARPFAALRRT